MSQLPPAPERRSGALAQMSLLSRRLLPVLLLLVLGTAATTGALTRLQPDRYVSTISFVVQTTNGANDTETLIRTMQALVSTEIVGADLAAAAGTGLTAEQVVTRLSVARPPGAGVFTVAVDDTDLERSRSLAEQLVPVFQARVEELSQPKPGQLSVTYSIRPWAAGAINTTTTVPPVLRNTVLGAGLGGLLGVLLLSAGARRRPVLLTPEHVMEVFRLPLLGALPPWDRLGADPSEALDVVLASGSAASWPARPQRLLVVASRQVPDRARVLLALAGAWQRDGDVVVLDAGGGRGSLTSVLRLRGRRGLSDAVLQPHDARHVLQAVPGGPVPPGPREITHGTVRVAPVGVAAWSVTSAPALARLLDDLARDADVLLDVTGTGDVLAWGPLARTVDAVLVLAEVGRTRVVEAEQMADALAALRDHPVAVLLLDHERLLTADALAVADPRRVRPAPLERNRQSGRVRTGGG